MKFKVKKLNDIKIGKVGVVVHGRSKDATFYNSDLNTFYKLYKKSAGTLWDTYELMKFDFKRNQFKFADVGSLASIMKKLPDTGWYRATATEIKEPEVDLPSPICKDPKFSFTSLYNGQFRVELVVLASQIKYFDENKNEMSAVGTLVKLDEVDAIRCKEFCLKHKIEVVLKEKFYTLKVGNILEYKISERDLIEWGKNLDQRMYWRYKYKGIDCEIILAKGMQYTFTDKESPSLKERFVEKLKAKTPLKIKVTPKTSEWVQKICFENAVYWYSGNREVTKTDKSYLFIYMSDPSKKYDIVFGNRFSSREDFMEEFIIDEKEI